MPTVTVGCKLPHGLVLEIVEVGKSDGKEMLNPAPVGKRVTLAGANSLHTGILMPATLQIAYTAVDADFWAAWLKKNSDLAFVKNGMVFAAEKPADAQAMGREHAKEKSGFEGLNQAGDKRAGNVQADSEMQAKHRRAA